MREELATRRTMLAAIVGLICALMLFSLVIGVPEAWAKTPAGPLFLPLFGLVAGPLLCPATTLCSLVAISVMIGWLGRLSLQRPWANGRKAWVLAGALVGAAMGAVFVMEIGLFTGRAGTSLSPGIIVWAICGGMFSGALSALVVRRTL